MLGHDDERRRSIALDVELDPSQAFEGDIEVGPVWMPDDRHAPIGYDEASALGDSFGLDCFIALEQSGD
jgi:hypothetical protein